MDEVLSVVIATKDRRQELLGCLRSLQRCACPPGWTAQVIVVDNGPHDASTEAVVRDLAQERLAIIYLSEPRRGKAFAVNTGTAAAHGSIVAFLDDDVTVEEDWMAALLTEFEHDPELDLLGGRVRNPDPSRRGFAISRHDKPIVIAASCALEGLAAGCNLAVRRHVFDVVRGRDTRLGPGRGLAYEDIDFIRRVLLAGFCARFSPKPVVFHRPGPRNRSVEYPRGRGAYYVKFILRGDPTVCRHAWWELCELWESFWWPAGRDRMDTLRRAWNLAVGATIMIGRMLKPPH